MVSSSNRRRLKVNRGIYTINWDGIKNDQGDYTAAVEYYEKSVAIKQKKLPPTHVDLAASYNNIGLVYNNMGEYSKGLFYYEQALEIFDKKLFQRIILIWLTSYSNIGSVYYKMGEYLKALFLF